MATESSSRSWSQQADDAVDVRRYLEALRRSRVLIAVIVVVVTGAALVASLLLPPRYEATARIVVDPTVGGLGPTDAESLQRQLATVESLSTTPKVIADAARTLNARPEAIEKRVSSSVDPNANVIAIVGQSGQARDAAAIANAVARAFLDQQGSIERDRLERAQQALTDQVRRLQAAPDPTGQAAEQIRALQARLAELSVSQASAGATLQLAQVAEVPDAPTTPRPMLNTILALFAAILLAVLVALARDQLTPAVGSQRELGQILDLPVLGTIPRVPTRLHRRGLMTTAEHEAFQALGAAVRLALPPSGCHVVLVTSASHAEGKTTVVAQLGRVLARTGHHTVLVSGDLRRPQLDKTFGVDGQPGMTDVLRDTRTRELDERQLLSLLRPVAQGSEEAGLLEILPAGRQVPDPADLLSGEGLPALFAALRRLGPTYVLVDAPPAVGVADAQLLAQQCDDLMVVSQLNRLNLNAAVDLRDTLARLGRAGLGVVVIGGRTEASPYYAGGLRSRVTETEPLLD
jgi:receptor protein-tyrosine kinase